MLLHDIGNHHRAVSNCGGQGPQEWAEPAQHERLSPCGDQGQSQRRVAKGKLYQHMSHSAWPKINGGVISVLSCSLLISLTFRNQLQYNQGENGDVE